MCTLSLSSLQLTDFYGINFYLTCTVHEGCSLCVTDCLTAEEQLTAVDNLIDGMNLMEADVYVLLVYLISYCMYTCTYMLVMCVQLLMCVRFLRPHLC